MALSFGEGEKCSSEVVGGHGAVYELGVCSGTGGSSVVHGGSAVVAASAASSAVDALVLSRWHNGRSHVSRILTRRDSRKRRRSLFCLKIIAWLID